MRIYQSTINKSLYTCLLTLLICLPSITKAHFAGQSYIFMTIHEDSYGGIFEISNKDLNKAFGTELGDRFTWDEITPHLEMIKAYYKEKVHFSIGGKELQFKLDSLSHNPSDELGTYLLMYFTLGKTSDLPDAIGIDYHVLFDEDPTHKGLVVMLEHWKAGILYSESNIVLSFDPSSRSKELKLDRGSWLTGTWATMRLGMAHIWEGIDHIFFLLALILPSVVFRTLGDKKQSYFGVPFAPWNPHPALKPALYHILKVVTAFTVAHSITLSLAVLGWADVNSRAVETIIAFSIGLAAFHNLIPILRGRDWVIAFVFGLFHGFGFAGFFGEALHVKGGYLAWTLLGFNAGVEIGQIAIVCAVFPVLFLLRKQKLYPYLLIIGSIGLMAIALFWTIERGFGIDIPVFALFK